MTNRLRSEKDSRMTVSALETTDWQSIDCPNDTMGDGPHGLGEL